MENEGWIKLHRKLLDNPIMLKPNYLSVWIYLLLKCNHENNTFIWNRRKVVVSKGSFIGSISRMSKELNLSTGTVSNVLDYFISENQVEKRSNRKFSLFKIINYDIYQGSESKVENKMKTKCKQDETNKNEKNEKNEKNRERGKPLQTTPAENMRIFLNSAEEQEKQIIRIQQKFGFSQAEAEIEISKFIEYWEEQTKSGLKQRWELQSTWNLELRINTWMQRSQERKTNQFKK